ncbi:deoxycytidylate deaminase [Alphaproteobacteria phage PhiJL001]|uniref:Deoxycytidylate deaminase n=1 Tax=Alphaproteobacteria phage PhiJL001 TaxID=2681607 RepID=Q5DN75_9CAUD|nr:deoxycytidylate deaminase [Alphaproteobacteria phage PhiJL001]AAT69506.1 deoxycytidylate deaminase [Alphaproteobacteria phage PhiJL001]
MATVTHTGDDLATCNGYRIGDCVCLADGEMVEITGFWMSDVTHEWKFLYQDGLQQKAKDFGEIDTDTVCPPRVLQDPPDPDQPPLPDAVRKALDNRANVHIRAAKWDRDYLKLAEFWANLKSKDPSTKVGAVVVSEDNRVVGMGYNGFPVGVEDSRERLEDRPTKYMYVVHAEPNAILTAGLQAKGGTLYCTLFPCNECAKLIIQSGIRRVVSWASDNQRWDEAHQVSRIMFDEAGVANELIVP